VYAENAKDKRHLSVSETLWIKKMKSIDKYVWVVNYTISKTVLQAIQKEIL
jgi:hypothetical protein